MRRFEAAAATAGCVWMLAAGAWAQPCIAPATEARLDRCPSGVRASAHRSGAPSLRADAPRHRASSPAAPYTLQHRTPLTEAHERREAALLEREREVLRRLLSRPGRGARRAEVLDRMAMTLEELLRARRTRIGEAEEAVFQARRSNPVRARALLAEQRQQRRLLEADRTELIETLAIRVRDHAERPGTDRTLFALAHYLEETQQSDRALQVYRRLVRDFPDSERVPHAYLAFAERAFAEADLELAGQLYERVLRIPAERNSVFGYALYKLAWVHQNRGDHRAALRSFTRVLEHARRYPDRSSSPSLARQVRRELVLPYAHVGRPDRALAFFRRIACPTGVGEACESSAFTMLDALGTHYLAQGQWPEAIATRRRSLHEQPDSEQGCQWQLDVLEGALASLPPDAQLEEVERTLAAREAFAERHPARASACTGRVAERAVLLATAWHREAVGTEDAPGTRSMATMARAGTLYGWIADRLPALDTLAMPSIAAADRPTAAQIAAFRGDLAYEQEDWTQCRERYSDALEGAVEPQLAADVAYRAVLCIDRELGARAPVAEPPEGPRRALTDDESRMVAAFSRFRCVAPDDPELPVVLYRWAQVLFSAHRFEEAAVLYRRVALEHASSEVGEFAANLYLESLNSLIVQESRTRCEPVLRAALDPLQSEYECDVREPGHAAHPQLCQVLTDLRCGLTEREAETMSRQGHPADGARHLLTMLREHGDRCVDRTRMLFNAAGYFERANLLGRAIRVRSVLVEQHPDSPLAARALHANAASYHAIALYEQAAEHYERYSQAASRCADDADLGPCPDAAEGLRDAVLFRLSLGQSDRARADVARLEREHRRAHPELVLEAVFAMGMVPPLAEDPVAQARHYRAFLRRFGERASYSQRARALLRVARGRAASGRANEALELYREVVAQLGPGQLALSSGGPEDEVERVRLYDAVSEARFELAEALRARYDALAFPALHGNASVVRVNRWASEALQPWVTEKMALLEEAARAYREVAELGMPRWQIAAASRQGDMVMDLVEQVRESPVPTSIARDPELRGAYLDALDDVAAPYERVAIAGYERCLETATRARWFDARSRRCERALHRLDSARFPIASELRGAPEYRPAAAAPPSAVSL